MMLEHDAPATLPLGQGKHLALSARESLRQGLVTAFTGILAHSRQQEPGADPAFALHEHRKAIRRARALLRLMDDVVGVEGRDVSTSTLREVHRATSALRDRHVVLGALDDLVLDEEAAPGTGGRADADDAEDGNEIAAAARRLRESIRATPAPDGARVAQALADGAARVEPLPRLLDGAMPRKVQWRAVIDGLATTHRRARRKLRAARRTGADEAVHGLRKRIKELTYQVELLADLAGKRGRKTRKRLSRLSHELGEVADLMVLRAYAAEHLEPGVPRDGLTHAIEKARARRLDRALKRARGLLDDAPQDFARKLVEAARKGRKTARKEHEAASAR